MMEIRDRILENFPGASISIIAPNHRHAKQVSNELRSPDIYSVEAEKSQKRRIPVVSLTMENGRQNEQNSTVKARKNWRNHRSNSLIEPRVDDDFHIILDKLRGRARSVPNDRTPCQNS